MIRHIFNPFLCPSLIADDGFNRNLEIQDLLCVGEQVADCFRQLMANPDTPQPVTDTHTTCLLDVVNLLTSCQMGFPRLFFQSLQVCTVLENEYGVPTK